MQRAESPAESPKAPKPDYRNAGEGQEAAKEGEEKEGSEGEDKEWGGRDLEKVEIVTVYAEGKENTCLVGQFLQRKGEIKEKEKGAVIDQGHYL